MYNEKFPIVGTIDCQCVIIHSKLIKNYNLSFDENLTFNLYAEDFCINAREKFNITSKIIQLKCQHYSYGNISNDFCNSYKYLQKKYKNSKNMYTTICIDKEVIGGKIFF